MTALATWQKGVCRDERDAIDRKRANDGDGLCIPVMSACLRLGCDCCCVVSNMRQRQRRKSPLLSRLWLDDQVRLSLDRPVPSFTRWLFVIRIRDSAAERHQTHRLSRQQQQGEERLSTLRNSSVYGGSLRYWDGGRGQGRVEERKPSLQFGLDPCKALSTFATSSSTFRSRQWC